jgi:hypothetical protein
MKTRSGAAVRIGPISWVVITITIATQQSIYGTTDQRPRAAGVSERAIMNQTGQKSAAVVWRYIREGSLISERTRAAADVAKLACMLVRHRVAPSRSSSPGCGPTLSLDYISTRLTNSRHAWTNCWMNAARGGTPRVSRHT